MKWGGGIYSDVQFGGSRQRNNKRNGRLGRGTKAITSSVRCVVSLIKKKYFSDSVVTGLWQVPEE